jgi:hypothetical protein
MGIQINTIESRIRFVKKESADVGDGTDFPMLVTLDQLAEIMYRVRDAWFTAGSVVKNNSTTSISTTSIKGAPTAQLVNNIIAIGDIYGSLYGTSFTYARAYSASDTVSEKFDSHFGEEYSYYSENFRDCTSEIGIWYPDYGRLYNGSYPYGYLDVGFRCGFSHMVECFETSGFDPAPSDFYRITTITTDSGGGSSIQEYTSSLSVIFTGEVAYIGDSPTSPTAQLYVGLNMGAEAGYYGINTSSSIFGGIPAYDTGCKFVLVLAGGDSVSCKLYSPDTYDSVSDFVLQAQEWWPYAKSDGTPAWSETTGLPL